MKSSFDQTIVNQGVVKYWSGEKGFGFLDGKTLAVNPIEKDVFFHIGQLSEPVIAKIGLGLRFVKSESRILLRKDKSKVAFVLGENHQGPCAAMWCNLDAYLKAATKFHNLPVVRLVQLVRIVGKSTANNVKKVFESAMIDHAAVIWHGRPLDPNIQNLAVYNAGDRIAQRHDYPKTIKGGINHIEHVGYVWERQNGERWEPYNLSF